MWSLPCQVRIVMPVVYIERVGCHHTVHHYCVAWMAVLLTHLLLPAKLIATHTSKKEDKKKRKNELYKAPNADFVRLI